VGVISCADSVCVTPNDVAKYNIPSLTTIFLIASSSLLEHSLQLQWCKANNQPNKCIDRPSKYCLTLDRHGQHDKQDVMISPYFQDGLKNLLIPKISTSVSALLSDLFPAPSLEAPNIRSHLCHGTWNDEVIQELESLAHWMLENNEDCHIGCEFSSSTITSNSFLVNAACIITSSLELQPCNLAGGSRLTRHKRVYSYTAMWTWGLNASITDLSTLEQLISYDHVRGCIDNFECKQLTMISDLKAFELNLTVLTLTHIISC